MPKHEYRALARERAVQFLYGLEFTHYDPAEAWPAFWVSYESRPSVQKYAEALVEGVTARREELDGHIAGALKNWSLDRVGRVERNILRVALYEIACVPDVPAKVAINEAIELAKRYGTDDATGFINGVLDRLKGLELQEHGP